MQRSYHESLVGNIAQAFTVLVNQFNIRRSVHVEGDDLLGLWHFSGEFGDSIYVAREMSIDFAFITSASLS